MLKDALQPVENSQSEAFRKLCLKAYFENPTDALRQRQENSLKALTFASEDELRECLMDPRVTITRCGDQVYLSSIHPDVVGDYTPTHMIATKANGSGGASTPFLEGCAQFPNHWQILEEAKVLERRSNAALLEEPFMDHPPATDREAIELLRRWGKPPLTTLSPDQTGQFGQLANPGQIVYLIDAIDLNGSSTFDIPQFVKSLKESVPGRRCLLVLNAPQSEATQKDSLTYAIRQTGLPLDVVSQQDYGEMLYSNLTPNHELSVDLSIGKMQRMNAQEFQTNPTLIKALSQIEHQRFGIDTAFSLNTLNIYDKLPYPIRSLYDQCFSEEQVRQVLTAPDEYVEKFIYLNGDQPLGYFVQMTEAGMQSEYARAVTSHNPRAYCKITESFRVTINWVKDFQADGFNELDLIKMLSFIAPQPTFRMFQDTGRQLGNSALPVMYYLTAINNTQLVKMETHNLAVLGIY